MIFIADEKTVKAVSPTGKGVGSWDSIHVFEAIDKGHTNHYKLTSTVTLYMKTSGENVGEVDLSGNMTRQVEQDMAVHNDSWHIINIGKVREFNQDVIWGCSLQLTFVSA